MGKELTPEDKEYHHNRGQKHGAEGNDKYAPLTDCYGMIEENARKNAFYNDGFKHGREQREKNKR